MANENERDPSTRHSLSGGKSAARARVTDEEAGEDETSAKEYDEQRGRTGRQSESSHAATGGSTRVDEDVELDKTAASGTEARTGEIGEQTETRRSRGPRAAGANPDVS